MSLPPRSPCPSSLQHIASSPSSGSFSSSFDEQQLAPSPMQPRIEIVTPSFRIMPVKHHVSSTFNFQQLKSMPSQAQIKLEEEKHSSHQSHDHDAMDTDHHSNVSAAPPLVSSRGRVIKPKQHSDSSSSFAFMPPHPSLTAPASNGIMTVAFSPIHEHKSTTISNNSTQQSSPPPFQRCYSDPMPAPHDSSVLGKRLKSHTDDSLHAVMSPVCHLGSFSSNSSASPYASSFYDIDDSSDLSMLLRHHHCLHDLKREYVLSTLKRMKLKRQVSTPRSTAITPRQGKSHAKQTNAQNMLTPSNNAINATPSSTINTPSSDAKHGFGHMSPIQLTPANPSFSGAPVSLTPLDTSALDWPGGSMSFNLASNTSQPPTLTLPSPLRTPSRSTSSHQLSPLHSPIPPTIHEHESEEQEQEHKSSPQQTATTTTNTTASSLTSNHNEFNSSTMSSDSDQLPAAPTPLHSPLSPSPPLIRTQSESKEDAPPDNVPLSSNASQCSSTSNSDSLPFPIPSASVLAGAGIDPSSAIYLKPWQPPPIATLTYETPKFNYDHLARPWKRPKKYMLCLNTPLLPHANALAALQNTSLTVPPSPSLSKASSESTKANSDSSSSSSTTTSTSKPFLLVLPSLHVVHELEAKETKQTLKELRESKLLGSTEKDKEKSKDREKDKEKDKEKEKDKGKDKERGKDKSDDDSKSKKVSLALKLKKTIEKKSIGSSASSGSSSTSKLDRVQGKLSAKSSNTATTTSSNRTVIPTSASLVSAAEAINQELLQKRLCLQYLQLKCRLLKLKEQHNKDAQLLNGDFTIKTETDGEMNGYAPLSNSSASTTHSTHSVPRKTGRLPKRKKPMRNTAPFKKAQPAALDDISLKQLGNQSITSQALPNTLNTSDSSLLSTVNTSLLAANNNDALNSSLSTFPSNSLLPNLTGLATSFSNSNLSLPTSFPSLSTDLFVASSTNSNSALSGNAAASLSSVNNSLRSSGSPLLKSSGFPNNVPFMPLFPLNPALNMSSSLAPSVNPSPFNLNANAMTSMMLAHQVQLQMLMANSTKNFNLTTPLNSSTSSSLNLMNGSTPSLLSSSLPSNSTATTTTTATLASTTTVLNHNHTSAAITSTVNTTTSAISTPQETTTSS